jgi:putative transposase
MLNRGVGRMRLFDDDGDYLAFEKVFVEGLEKYPAVRLCSFCVMPNHWHLVVWPEGGKRDRYVFYQATTLTWAW